MNEELPLIETVGDMFTHIVRHLLKQGGPALDTGSGRCMYRAENGRKCAVGSIIADLVYHPSLESRTIYDPRVWRAVVCSVLISPKDSVLMLDVLLALQLLHDRYGLPEQRPFQEKEWGAYIREGAAGIASKYKLSMHGITTPEAADVS